MGVAATTRFRGGVPGHSAGVCPVGTEFPFAGQYRQCLQPVGDPGSACLRPDLRDHRWRLERGCRWARSVAGGQPGLVCGAVQPAEQCRPGTVDQPAADPRLRAGGRSVQRPGGGCAASTAAVGDAGEHERAGRAGAGADRKHRGTHRLTLAGPAQQRQLAGRAGTGVGAVGDGGTVDPVDSAHGLRITPAGGGRIFPGRPGGGHSVGRLRVVQLPAGGPVRCCGRLVLGGLLQWQHHRLRRHAAVGGGNRLSRCGVLPSACGEYSRHLVGDPADRLPDQWLSTAEYLQFLGQWRARPADSAGGRSVPAH